MEVKTHTILLVEDSPADADLTCMAIKRNSDAIDIMVVENGDAALEFVRNPDNSAPSLILLDLNMPGIDGHEVLRILKNEPGHRCIPVIILSSSDAALDVNQAFDNHANAYLRKPLGFKNMMELTESLINFWLHQSALPSAS